MILRNWCLQGTGFVTLCKLALKYEPTGHKRDVKTKEILNSALAHVRMRKYDDDVNFTEIVKCGKTYQLLHWCISVFPDPKALGEKWRLSGKEARPEQLKIEAEGRQWDGALGEGAAIPAPPASGLKSEGVLQARLWEFRVNSNRFWDTATYWPKIANLSYPTLIERPRLG